MNSNSSSQHRLFAADPDPWELDAASDLATASVVFSENPFGPYTYAIPEKFRGKLAIGMRVKVPLGRSNRSLVGYCSGLGHRGANAAKLKDIQEIIDKQPLLSTHLWHVTQWMSQHYLCPLGQALEAVVPAGVRGQAGTREATFLSVPTAVAARLASLKLPPKQMHVLKILSSAARPLTPPELAEAARCTLGPIQELRKKQLITAITERIQTVTPDIPAEIKEKNLQLEHDQAEALAAILRAMESGQHEAILLHGVTGSGKTEVYIQAIEETLKFGRQAIVLVPEISLTPQTRQRFRSRFERVAVLHSHLSDSERHWHWQQIAAGEIDVVVGARSAVFAPVARLGLIIIDEEHEPSFKQDTIPRYHAREVALQRTRTENVPLVLGTATPSLECWYKAQQKEIRLVSMPQRVNRFPLPEVSIIDMRYEIKQAVARGAISRPLKNAIHQTLQQQGQVILLLNRRGYATHIQCPACGYVAKCPHCEVSLTHHKEFGRLLCHYCEMEMDAPPICPDCKFQGIRYSGLGTERLEAEVQAQFPQAIVLRMDSDTMKKPGSHEAALAKFRTGEAQILLGTQMIAKGLDFPNVMLVGVVNADTSLHFPDFRAAERTFQLVTQVAGRTGRGERGGRVIVQTFSPEHPAILCAMKHDYEQFANFELPIRHDFGYPPHTSMVRFIVRGELEKKTEEFATQVTEALRSALLPLEPQLRLMGPAPCPLSKLRNLYRFHSILTVPNMEPLRATLQTTLAAAPVWDDIQWAIDIDPQDML